jgi:hypothetical protein
MWYDKQKLMAFDCTLRPRKFSMCPVQVYIEVYDKYRGIPIPQLMKKISEMAVLLLR